MNGSNLFDFLDYRGFLNLDFVHRSLEYILLEGPVWPDSHGVFHFGFGSWLRLLVHESLGQLDGVSIGHIAFDLLIYSRFYCHRVLSLNLNITFDSYELRNSRCTYSVWSSVLL